MSPRSFRVTNFSLVDQDFLARYKFFRTRRWKILGYVKETLNALEQYM